MSDDGRLFGTCPAGVDCPTLDILKKQGLELLLVRRDITSVSAELREAAEKFKSLTEQLCEEVQRLVDAVVQSRSRVRGKR